MMVRFAESLMTPPKTEVVEAGTAIVRVAAEPPPLPTNWLEETDEASVERPPIDPLKPLRSKAPLVPLPPSTIWLADRPALATPRRTVPLWTAVDPVIVFAEASPVRMRALPPATLSPSFLVVLVNLPA